MQKIFILIIGVVITGTAYSQTEKFDIATFTPPSGWQRMDSNGVLAFHDFQQTNNTLTSFCQILLYPSKAGSGNAVKDFNAEWKDRVVKTTGTKTKPVTQTDKMDDGWTVITGSATISAKGMTYACMLVTMSGFGKVMSVLVNTAGADYRTTINQFFSDLNLDSKAIANNKPANNPASNQPNMSGTITMGNYEFIAPEKWQVQNNKDFIKLLNTESGCFIQMLAPQQSSGNIEEDAKAVFDLMYNGWKYQNTGEKKYTLSKGYLPKGLEYCMMEAEMGKPSADGSRYDGYESGAAMVVKAGAQIVILSIRHNTSLMGHNDCDRKYNTMRRFFNSFTVKNVAAPANTAGSASDRIIGKWGMMESGAIGEYVFAANGHYAFGGALGQSHTTSDYNYEYLHTKTYSWDGDGSYSISGNQLTLKKRGRPDNEQITFRFEKVNHGGTAWTDRLYMLTKDTYGNSEVRYEKKDK